jgi:hypothetical protein
MYKIWVDVERAGFMGSNIHENQQGHAEWRLHNFRVRWTPWQPMI